MKKNAKIVGVVLGAGAVVVGFVLQLTTASYGSFLWVLSAVLIGLGCGAFGHSLGICSARRRCKATLNWPGALRLRPLTSAMSPCPMQPKQRLLTRCFIFLAR